MPDKWKPTMTKEEIATLERSWAKSALSIQDASNPSGIIHEWARITKQMMDVESEKGLGTDWVRTHPVTILFADKMTYLTGRPEMMAYGKAVDQCKQTLAEKGS